jgi:hypothetical protein
MGEEKRGKSRQVKDLVEKPLFFLFFELKHKNNQNPIINTHFFTFTASVFHKS